MSFVKEYKNYSTNTLPYVSINQAPNSPTQENFTYENIEYSFKKEIVNASSIIYNEGITFDLINQNAPLLILKSKNTDRYIIFNMEISGRHYYVYTYVNNIPSIENALKVGQISSIIANYTTSEYRHCIALTPDHIGFGIFGGSANIVLCHMYTIDSLNSFMGEIDSVEYSDEFGKPSTEDNYGGDFDEESDVIPMPETSQIGVSNVGFINVYKTSINALQNLGSELFPDFIPPTPAQPTESVGDALVQGFNNVVENLSQLLTSYINSNLINYIIDCHCIPVTPQISSSERIKIGFKEFTQTASRITTDYVDFDCGTISIKEHYGNFIDYVGTRAQLYLPFVGFVPIKNEYFQNGFLQVIYRFNVVDGSFMCFLLSSSSKSELKNSVVATYSGNACIHLAITGLNYSNMLSGVVNGSSAVSSLAKGNVGQAVNGALNVLSLKPEMQSSNSYNSTSAYLGIRYPYLLIEREVSNFSKNYTNEHGIPLNVTKVIKELSGFVQMDNIHIDIACMEEERSLIYDALTNGIIV